MSMPSDLEIAAAAALRPMADVAAYASSKFASVGFSMVLRSELAGSGIELQKLGAGRTHIDALADYQSTRIALELAAGWPQEGTQP